MPAPPPAKPPGAAGAPVKFLGSFPSPSVLPAATLPEVAFAGRSNVGKSSAINALLGRQRVARVSGRPGRTQAINLMEVGGRLIFADLPGYGFARVPEAVRVSWGALVEGYLGERETLRLVVVLVDARHPPQPLDIELVEGLLAADLPILVVATKIDRISKSKRKPTLNALAAGLGVSAVIGFSSPDGDGVATVWAVIDAACRR